MCRSIVGSSNCNQRVSGGLWIYKHSGASPVKTVTETMIRDGRLCGCQGRTPRCVPSTHSLPSNNKQEPTRHSSTIQAFLCPLPEWGGNERLYGANDPSTVAPCSAVRTGSWFPGSTVWRSRSENSHNAGLPRYHASDQIWWQRVSCREQLFPVFPATPIPTFTHADW